MTAESRLAGLAALIDHTLLKTDATAREIEAICNEARRFGFGAVCVNPCRVAPAVQLLHGTSIRVTTVIAFPLGASKTEIKVAEAMAAVEDGALEIDMVANLGLLFDGSETEYEAEIRKVRRNLPDSVGLKVILEAGLLSQTLVQVAVAAAINAGAQYVKSGTGFCGACTVGQIEQLARYSRGQIKVKASGGIRTLEGCRQMLKAGADRIGTSVAVAIMKEWEQLANTTL